MTATRQITLLCSFLICNALYAQIDITGAVQRNFYEIYDQVPVSELLRPSDQEWSEELYPALLNNDLAKAGSLLDSLRSLYQDETEYRYYASWLALKSEQYSRVSMLLDSFPLTRSDPWLRLVHAWSRFASDRPVERKNIISPGWENSDLAYLIHYTLACTYMAERELNSAEEQFQLSIGMEPYFGPGYLGISMASFFREEYGKAFQYANECLIRDPSNKKARLMKIILGIYLDVGENDPAADLQWLMEAEPENEHYLYLDGLIQFAMGYPAHALDNIRYGMRVEAEKTQQGGGRNSFRIIKRHDKDLILAVNYFYICRPLLSVEEREMAETCLVYYFINEHAQFRDHRQSFIKISENPMGELLSLMSESDNEKREVFLQRFLENEPEYEPVMIERVQSLIGRKSNMEVIEALSAILANDPNNIEFLNLRSQLFLSEKNYVRAYRDLNRMVFLDSTNREAIYYRGISALQLGHFENARSDFKIIHDHLGDQNDILQLLYFTSLQLKDTTNARSYLKRTLDAGNYTAVNMKEMGNWYIFEQDFESGIKWFSTAILQFPEDNDLKFLRAYCRYMNGDHREAAEEFRDYNRKNKNAESLYYLGMSLRAMGDPEGEEFLEEARNMGFTGN